ncbi:helix-turn-helix domain-containing protein [Planctomycetota bacterium]
MAGNEYKRFFVDNPLKNPYIRVRGVGYREQMRSTMVRRPQGTGDYLFMLFYDPVRIGTSDRAKAYDSSYFIVWPPGAGHFYGNGEAPFLHTWTHCEGVWIEKAVKAAGFPLSKPQPVSNAGMIEDYVTAIYREVMQVRPEAAIVRNLYENWLREVKRDSRMLGRQKAVPEWLINVRNFMAAGYREKMTLDELAAQAHKSVPHLCSEFKKHFGRAPIEYLIRLRLNEALHLLPDINLAIGQIAERVGYEDIYHFSKLFKKHYGISPMGMRRRKAGH